MINKAWRAIVCLIGLLFVAGCQPQLPAESRLSLRGTYVTVEMTGKCSQDLWPSDGPIQILAQNQLCAVEVLRGGRMDLTFADGCGFRLDASPSTAPTTQAGIQITSAATIADIKGGRIDAGPATLRNAIRSRGECAPDARRLATAWLATGDLEFHGRTLNGDGPIAALFPGIANEFDAHTRLTPAGAAILRDALRAEPDTLPTAR